MTKKEKSMKNETFKGSVVQGLCTIIGALVTVILGGAGIVYYINYLNLNSTIYHNNGENIVNGDMHIDKSSEVSYNSYVYNSNSNDSLDMAYAACLEGDFNTAYHIFKESKEAVALINMGYIYTYGFSYVGEDIQKAEECYQKADCVEADRNLFILYLKNGMMDEAVDKCVELLWTWDDNVTWDYIANCLYQKTWVEHQEETGCTKADFSFDINLLYEWKYIDNYYRGYNPPSNTASMQWILQGVDFDVGDGVNHPYSVYRAQMRVYAMGVNVIENMYYELDGKLYPLDI